MGQRDRNPTYGPEDREGIRCSSWGAENIERSGGRRWVGLMESSDAVPVCWLISPLAKIGNFDKS